MIGAFSKFLGNTLKNLTSLLKLSISDSGFFSLVIVTTSCSNGADFPLLVYLPHIIELYNQYKNLFNSISLLNSYLLLAKYTTIGTKSASDFNS